MASNKEYQLLFQLTAALGPGFAKSFQEANQTMKMLKENVSGVNKTLQDITAYKKQQQAVTTSKERVKELEKEHESLQNELNKSGVDTAQLNKQLKANEKALEKARKQADTEVVKLEEMGTALQQAGVNTSALSEETSKLEKEYKRLSETQDKLQKIELKKQANSSAIEDTKKQLTRNVGGIVALGAAMYAGPVKSAMDFESNMAEVAKVVDWLKNDSGEITKEYTNLKKEILSITTEIPMTAEEITQIMAAAGQSNVAKNNEELVEFTKSAAKMGIAFDTTSEQAGEWMAKWRTSFKMSQSEVIELSDKINYLGNTSASNALEISEIVTKIGPLGEVAGFASGEIAALGASLVATGVQPDVAATGIKNLMLAMVQGESVTKRQGAVLKSLGIDAKQLAQRMQTDAQGAILDFLKAVKKLPEAQQAAKLKDFFGKESVNAIAPLLTNLDYLGEQFKKVGDKSLYAGSMEAEYAARADTVENKVQLAKGSIAALNTAIGDLFLPYIGQAAEKIKDVIVKVTEFTQQNPKLVKGIMVTVGSLMALNTASLVAKLGFLQIRGGMLSIQSTFTIFKNLKLPNYLSSITGAFLKLGSSQTIFSKFFRSILKTYMFIPSMMGKMIKNSKLTKLFVNLFGGLSTAIAPILGKIKVILGPIGRLGTMLLGPFAGIVGKMLPVVGVVTMLITVFQMLKNNLESVRNFIKNTFGDGALAIFDKMVQFITNIGNVIKGIFSDGNLGNVRQKIESMFGEKRASAFDTFVRVLHIIQEKMKTFIIFIDNNIVPVAMKLFDVIANTIIPGIINFVSAAAPIIMSMISSVISFIGNLIPVIGEFIANMMPIFEQIINMIKAYVLPVLAQVGTFITDTLLPAVLNAIQIILPVIQNAIEFLIPLIQNGLTMIWGIISPVLDLVLSAIQFLMPAIIAYIQSGVDTISSIINNLMMIFQGIIDFIQGVFTGNWSQAWNGIKEIFRGAVGGLGDIIRGPLNAVVSAVNKVIDGLNMVKLPKALGGKGINIPRIPGFRHGANYTPDTFIAGEDGPELILGASGRRVLTNSQTREFFNRSEMIEVPEIQSQTKQANEVQNITLQITNSHTIHGSENLKEILEKYDQELLYKIEQMIKDIMEEVKTRKERTSYV